ncbi:MAG: glycosyltransferase family 4 protein [Bacillus sp. (in: Bacteria)]|nr:glycosyltransferase family 4 protein [Bacillus sp. (in: firmicutes)]MCM1425498.1 glycosyltransferase family 4 protein [Eubacterium sp.]
MEKIAVDLLWLRPGKVGGTESYIRNLLDGFLVSEEDFDFTLLVSLDNKDTFQKYEKDNRYHLLVANITSENIAKRILWQNVFQNRLLRRQGFRKCFEPVYCKPWLNGGIQYTCVIHDLQAFHYPNYHPFHEVAYSRLCWRMDVMNAARIVAISNWVKSDIVEKYHRKDIEVIYNPILVKENETVDFGVLQKKYQIEQKQFFYTVSQMIPHKNLQTLLGVMERIAGEKSGRLPNKLLISGINGNAAKELKEQIQEKNLQAAVVLTGVVSNEERNCLYQNCHTFLFPSVFEGFGMPPVEAMLFKTRVVTTRCASIPEVTQGKAVYVENPYDIDEWIKKILEAKEQKVKDQTAIDFDCYAPESIARQYLAFLKEPIWKKR